MTTPTPTKLPPSEIKAFLKIIDTCFDCKFFLHPQHALQLAAKTLSCNEYNNKLAVALIEEIIRIFDEMDEKCTISIGCENSMCIYVKSYGNIDKMSKIEPQLKNAAIAAKADEYNEQESSRPFFLYRIWWD